MLCAVSSMYSTDPPVVVPLLNRNQIAQVSLRSGLHAQQNTGSHIGAPPLTMAMT